MGMEAVARPHINGFYRDLLCTYVPDDIQEFVFYSLTFKVTVQGLAGLEKTDGVD